MSLNGGPGARATTTVNIAAPPLVRTARPGAATNIAVGGNGSVWVTGSNPVPSGYGIYQWTGSNWAPYRGDAVHIAVDPFGSPWVVNSTGQIYHWDGSGWLKYPGAATNIAVGANGSVWIVGTNQASGSYGIYRWTESSWAPYPGGAVHIAVDPLGQPWLTNASGQICHWDGNSWLKYPGTASDIGVGANGRCGSSVPTWCPAVMASTGGRITAGRWSRAVRSASPSIPSATRG